RPILTAARAIKQYSKENENDMVISPMFKTDFFIEQQPSHSEISKTREQLEQDLFEL
ncbi:unnamed protein product, partial [Rotaria magnacalcarata]